MANVVVSSAHDDDFRDISFRLASKELSPVLICREGLIRSPQRSAYGRRAWNERCFVLVGTQLRAEAEPHVQQQHQVGGTVTTPTLIVYEAESSARPTLVVKLSALVPGALSSPLPSVSGAGDTAVSVRAVDDHPTHMKIEALSSSATLLPSWMSVGTDAPRISSVPGDTNLFILSWRLKFPDGDTAEMWKESIQTYLAMPPPEPPQSLSPSERRGSAQSGTVAPAGAGAAATSMANTAALSSPLATSLLSDRRKRRALAHLALLCGLVLILAFAPRPEGGGAALIKRKLKKNENSTTDTESPIPAVVVANHLLHEFQVAWALVLHAVSGPPRSMERPAEIQDTFLRRSLAFARSGLLFRSELALRSEYFWFGLPAVFVLVVSFSSIVHRAFGQTMLGRTVMKSKYWLAPLIYILMAVLSGHDTYVNHWRYPLCYGLYWKGYAQSLCSVGCLGACKVSIDRARYLRPRNPVSPARQVASALACLLATVSLPLILRAVDVSSSSRSISLNVGTLALLCFFAGLHFFGWARRRMVIGGIQVGESIYQFSLMPRNFAYRFLWVLGDVGQHLLTETRSLVEYVMKHLCFPFSHWIRSLVQILATWLTSAYHYAHPLVSDTMRYVSIALERVRIKTRDAITWLQSVVESAQNKISKALVAGCRFLQNNIAKPLLQTYAHCKQASVRIMRLFMCKISEAVLATYRFLINTVVQPLYCVICNCIHLSMDTLHIICVVLHETCFLPTFRAMLRIAQRAGEVLTEFLLIISDFVADTVVYVHHSIMRPLFQTLYRSIIQPLHWALHVHVHYLIKESIRILRTCVASTYETTKCALANATRSMYTNARLFILHFIVPAIRNMCNIIAAVMGPFLQKYWQLVSTALLLNGSFLFAAAALDAVVAGRWLASIQYALGAWSLLLVGCTIFQGVFSSSGNLARQRVTVDETVLQHVDLCLCFAVFQVVAAGWHALSTLLSLVLNSFDFVIRKSLKRLWELLGLVRGFFLKPVQHALTGALQHIWNSPFVSSFLSILVLITMYLHHTEWIAISAPSWNIFRGALDVLATALFHQFSNTYRIASSLLSPPAKFVSIVFKDVYAPLVYADVSSPGVALWCWMFSCVVAKTRARVRIKWFAVPTFLMYFMGGATTALLRASFVSSIVWVGFSLFVDQYEDQSRRRTAAALAIFQQQRRSGRARPPSASQTRTHPQASAPSFEVVDAPIFDKEECVICLDELGHAKCSKLPCGHQFHEQCICIWLDRSNCQRCPMCRRATGGLDRVLEIIF